MCPKGGEIALAESVMKYMDDIYVLQGLEWLFSNLLSVKLWLLICNYSFVFQKSMSLQTVAWNPHNSHLKTPEPRKPINYHIYWHKTKCYSRLQKYASRYLCIISTVISHGLFPIP